MAEQVMRRNEIYEIKYPETTRFIISSNNRRVNNKDTNRNRIIRFSRELIKGTPLEDRLSSIDDIEKQKEIVEAIINGEANTLAGLFRKEKLQKTNGIPLPEMM